MLRINFHVTDREFPSNPQSNEPDFHTDFKEFNDGEHHDHEEFDSTSKPSQMDVLKSIIFQDFAEGRFQDCFNTIAKLQNPSNEFKVLKAKCLVEFRKFALAKEIFEEVLKEEPKNFDAVVNHAKCLYYVGEFSSSISKHREILKCSLDQFRIKEIQNLIEKAQNLLRLLSEGRKLYADFKYRKASRIYGNALTIDPTNQVAAAIIHNNRAMVLKQLRYWKAALDDFKEVESLNPSDKTIFEKRAICHYKLKNYQQCINDCQEAMKIRSSKTTKTTMKKAQKKMNKNLGKGFYGKKRRISSEYKQFAQPGEEGDSSTFSSTID